MESCDWRELAAGSGVIDVSPSGGDPEGARSACDEFAAEGRPGEFEGWGVSEKLQVNITAQ